jgi:hypothetical protein
VGAAVSAGPGTVLGFEVGGSLCSTFPFVRAV